MKILFTTIKSPTNSEFKSLIEQVREQAGKDEVGLFLLQDAVYAAVESPSNPLKKDDFGKIKVYASKEDLLARGLDEKKLVDKVEVKETDAFIDLVMVDYEKVVSWS